MPPIVIRRAKPAEVVNAPNTFPSQEKGAQPSQLNGIASCETVRMKLDDLIPADYNPRSISEYTKKGLTASIDTFGIVQPIVWNRRTGNVVGGHQRLSVLKEKGYTFTDVVVIDVPAIKEKALNVTLNNKAIEGEFIQEALDTLMQEVSTMGSIEGIDVEALQLNTLMVPDIVDVKHDVKDNSLSAENDTIENPNFLIVKLPNEHGYLLDELASEVLHLIEASFPDKQITLQTKRAK